MKVEDSWSWQDDKTVTVAEAVSDYLSVDPYSGGAIEQLDAKVEKMEKLLFALVCRSAGSADDLNDLLPGCANRYKDLP